MSGLKFQHDAFLGAFEKKVMERVDSETNALANGTCADFVDYKIRAERIKSYRLILEDLGQVVKTYLEEDDDDD
jgi:hypothetical protein